MPIYEYVCRHCGEALERLQRMSDEPLTDCPSCGEAQLVKKVSAAGFRLSGSGWYETDFKSGNKKNLVGDDKPAATPKAVDKSKAESKPASTTKSADA